MAELVSAPPSGSPSAPPQPEAEAELQLVAQQLTFKAIQKAMFLLDYGSPAIQMMVIRSLLPAVGRVLTGQATEAEELTTMRVELQQLNQHLLSA